MEWKNYAKEIKKVLGLKGSPIAVTYSMDPIAKASKVRVRVCNALLQARDGKIIDLTKKNSECSGGTWHCGLAEREKGESERALKDFLVHGEKLFCSVTVFHRAMVLGTTPPLGLADHIILSPMEKAELPPDIVVFLCNPKQACRLVTLDEYGTGIPVKIEMTGATCHQVISYPIVSGELNVSLMDYTSRKIKGYTENDLFVSIPYHRFLGVMRSIPGCTAGTAKFEIPESFRRIRGAQVLEDLDA
jgi:uncharacterized protein (DUF169 family)